MFMRLLCFASLCAVVDAGKRGHTSAWHVDDAATTLNEAIWWHAVDHWGEVQAYVSASKQVRDTHLLDLFGASMAASSTWQAAGYKAVACDILLGPERFDLTSKTGFLNTLDVG